MCNKMPYQDKKEALKAARIIHGSTRTRVKGRRMCKAKGKDTKKMYPYFHTACGYWHLTSQKPRKH